MRSLRSLCLLKVQSLNQDVLDKSVMPLSLVKDLQIMQLVNARFAICKINARSATATSTVSQTALSIQFDGAAWTFRYRSNSFDISTCCMYCDFVEPKLQQFTLEEGTPIPTQSPFWETSNFLMQLEQEQDLMMVMGFEMDEDKSRGKMTFRGSEDFAVVPVIFHSDIVIEIGPGGQRKLIFDGFVGRGLQQQISHDFLNETEDIFTSAVVSFCCTQALEREWDLIWQLAAGEDPEDYVEDFWRLLNNF